MMTSDEQISAAQRLHVSLRFEDTPVTIARLVELIDDLQARVSLLEKKRR
jgi:hypothetical protein